MSQTVRTGTKQVQRRSVLPWFVWLLAIVAGVAWWVLYFSHWFVVTQITVLGAKRVPADQVSAVANSAINQPLIKVKLADIQKEVEKIAEVESATVERGWPHTVLVTIQERKPVAVAMSHGRYILVDDRGFAAGPKLANKPKGYKVIDGVASTPGMASAVAILNEIPKSWKIDWIGVRSQDSVVVHLKSGADITFGSGESAKQKVRVAQALLANKYKVIDVSAPDAPTVRKHS